MINAAHLARLLALLATTAALPAAAQNIVSARGNTLVTSLAAAPGTALSSVTLTGLPAGASLVSVDALPGYPRAVYGLTNTGQLYGINVATGQVLPAGNVTTAPVLPTTGAATTAFNPTNSLLRVITPAGANYAVNPATLTVATGTNVTYAPGDAGAGGTPRVVAAGYTPVTNGTTTLYVIDNARGVLATQGSVGGTPNTPGGGRLQTVGALGVPTTDSAALRINTAGQAYATLTAAPAAGATIGVTSLYLVNGTTGAATLVGALPGGATYNSFAFALPTLQSYGSTGSTAAVGGILDTLVLSNSPRAQALIASVDAQTTAAGQNSQLLALSPAAYQNLSQITLQSIHVQDVTVRRYLRDVRQGGTEAGAQAVTFGTDRHYAMWFTGNGRYGDLKSGVNRYRTSYGAYQFSGGVDYRFARGTLLGLYGGYDEATARLTPLSPQSQAKTWFAGGYGSGTVGPVYIDFQGTYGKTQFDVRRTVADGFGGGFEYSAANGREPRSEQYQGSATAGISKDFHGAEFEPYVGAKYAHVRLRSFSEGTQAGALSLNGIDTDSLESIAGLRVGIKVPLTATAVLRPSIRGEYRHEFDNAGRNRNLFGTFADGTGGVLPIAFRTNAFDEDYAAIGAGFTVSGNSPFSIVLDYNGQIGRETSIHGITGGFHLAF